MITYEELEIIYQDDDIPSVEGEINLEEVENEYITGEDTRQGGC